MGAIYSYLSGTHWQVTQLGLQLYSHLIESKPQINAAEFTFWVTGTGGLQR